MAPSCTSYGTSRSSAACRRPACSAPLEECPPDSDSEAVPELACHRAPPRGGSWQAAAAASCGRAWLGLRRRGVRRTSARGVFTWRGFQRVALAAVAVGGLLGCCGGGVLRVRGQEVVLGTDSDGCIASKAPGQPRNLKATPKDGRVLLRWDAPGDGACVSSYIVNVIDPLFRTDTPAQSTSTGSRTAVVEGLTNGHSYVFQVQAYNSQLMTGGIAQTTSIPTDLCNLSEAPGKPTNLRVQTGDNWARLCWDGVENDACVDQYRVSTALLSGPDFRTSADGQISRGGCANVTGLVSGARYNFSVIPTSVGQGRGKAASLTAEVGASAAAQNGWICRPMDGCAPNRGGLCEAGGGCKGVARRGDCKVPAMVDVDWVNKQVTQWCAPSCPCDLGPAQGGGALMGNGRMLGFLGAMDGSGIGGLAGAGLGSGAIASRLSSGLGSSSSGSGLQGNADSTAIASRLSSSLGGSSGSGLQGSSDSTSLPLASMAASLMSADSDLGFGGAGAGAGLVGMGLDSGSGGGALGGGLLSQSRIGQFVGGMAQDMVNSGLLGEAAGKVAQQVVSNQVNAVVRAMWDSGAAATAAGGRRMRLV